MSERPATAPLLRQPWSLDSIDWSAIPGSKHEETDALFYLVASASFIEITTDRYTRNLIDQFCGDDEITTWLEEHWLPEEMQHGHALRRYVQLAWPDFEWDRTYALFLDEFSAYCGADVLEPTRARELASRCVVETGTAVFYSTLSRISPNAVLASIAVRIKEDEIRHYKHFYRYFCRYQKAQATSRRAILSAVTNRLRMMDGEDSRIALKHLYNGTHPGECLDDAGCRELRRRSRRLIQPHFPYQTCAKMLLKPLNLGPRASRLIVPLTETVARWIVP